MSSGSPARCGRCGFWCEYPEDFKEKKHAGVCLWYRLRLPEDEVYKQRQCPDFFERIPQWDAKQHWAYAFRHHDLGRSWRASKRALIFSLIALGLSLLGWAHKFI